MKGVNSRVILLVCHAEDSWPILRHAVESGFQVLCSRGLSYPMIRIIYTDD